MSQLSRILLLVAALFAAPAIATPKFGTMGGIGSAASTYTGGEPTGGTFSIRGDTGAATFGSIAASGAASVGSLTSAGAASLGSITLTGTGAGAALSKQLPAQCANILAYGGGPSVADNSAAFAAAAAASNPANICVYAPGGAYTFTHQPSITLPSGATRGSVTIKGDGPDVTVFNMASGVSGPNLTITAGQQSVHVRDLTIAASATETSAAGLTFTNSVGAIASSAQSDVTNVNFRGTDGYNGTFRFRTAIYDNGVSNINFINDQIVGSSAGAAYDAGSSGSVGINLVGTSTTTPVQFNLIGCQLNYWNYAVNYGSYVQGVSIASSNFVGNSISIYVPAGNVLNDELAISTSQFNDRAYNIYVNAQLDGVAVSSSMFYAYGAASGGNAGANIYLQQASQYAISGNAFIGIVPSGYAAPNGVVIGTWLLDSGVITGNQFKSLSTAVYLQSGSKSVNVQSNSYSANATNVLNQGTGNVVGGGSQ